MRLLLLSLLVLIMVPNISATVLFNDSFERPASPTIGNNWDQYFNPSFTNISFGHMNIYGQLTSSYVYHNITPAVNTFQSEIYLELNQLSGTGDALYFFLRSGLPGSTNSAIRIVFYFNGDINITNVGQTYKVTDFSQGNNVSVSIHDLDFTSYRFNVTVDGVKYDNGGLGYPFRNNETQISVIDILQGSGTSGGLTELYEVCVSDNYPECSSTDSGISVQAVDSSTNVAISPVTFNLYNGTGTSDFLFSQTNSTGNAANFNVSNGNYTIVAESPSYVSQTTSLEHINSTALTMQLNIDNSVLFEFYDEQTNNQINNISYDFFSDDVAFSGNTTNGSIEFSSLQDGLYTLKYSNPNYRTRYYYIYVPIGANDLITNDLYLLNESEGNSYLPLILDSVDNTYDGYFQALRWYFLGNGSGAYKVVETSSVNAQGTATMFLEFNTAQYIFRAVDLVNNTIDASYNTPTELFNQVDTYRIENEDDFIKVFDQLGGLRATNIDFFNSTQEFYQFAYSGAPAALQNVCLQYTRVYGAQTNISQVCSTSSAATLVLMFNSTVTPGTYNVIAFGNGTDGTQYLLAQRSDSLVNRGAFPTNYLNVAGLIGFFISISGAFVAISNPLIGLLLSSAGLFVLGAGLLNVLPIGGFFFISLSVITVILGVIMKK